MKKLRRFYIHHYPISIRFEYRPTTVDPKTGYEVVCKGYWDKSEMEIVLDSSQPTIIQAATLYHEIRHAIIDLVLPMDSFATEDRFKQEEATVLREEGAMLPLLCDERNTPVWDFIMRRDDGK
jgi:hypothetical protein